MRSTRSSFRGRTTERGYILISAVVLAILYFALMELMLIDSSRALREATRFRARVVAMTLAESAAELSAAQLITQPSATVSASDDQGTMTAKMAHGPQPPPTPFPQPIPFTIDAQGEVTGAVTQKASVTVQGRIQGTKVSVDYTYHSY